MALPPKFKGHRLVFSSPSSANAAEAPEPLHTIEMFLDYVCPYSAKMFKTFHESVAPQIKKDPALAGKVQLVFRQQVQPWHPSSTLTHEAALAVQRLAPGRFFDFSAALFRAQDDFFDVNVVSEPRNATYRRLASLAASSAGLDEARVYALLEVPDKPSKEGFLNLGNEVTNDLKVVVKMARLVSVHVSPTVIFDGVVANDISSSWTAEQWIEYLKKSVA